MPTMTGCPTAQDGCVGHFAAGHLAQQGNLSWAVAGSASDRSWKRTPLGNQQQLIKLLILDGDLPWFTYDPKDGV